MSTTTNLQVTKSVVAQAVRNILPTQVTRGKGTALRDLENNIPQQLERAELCQSTGAAGSNWDDSRRSSQQRGSELTG